jgi:hypothetical protein
MLEDERELWWLLFNEAQQEGEFTMSIQNINTLQDQAQQAFDRVSGSDAPAWAQVVAQCEIAQQLARIATQLEDGRMALLEGDDIVAQLARISRMIEDE